MNNATPAAAQKPERGYDFGLSNPAWDYPPVAQPGMQYLILSAPRSGSTMLSSALVASRVAGVPVEYFHFDELKKLGEPLTPQKAMTHLEAVRRRRTTPNGVFGMKLHGGQFRAAFMRPQMTPEGLAFLRRFSHVILITRTDKVAQAMSYMRSLKTGLWNSSLESDRKSARYVFAEEDTPELCRTMGVFKADEIMWKAFCSGLNLKALPVTYEEMAASPAEVLRRVFAFLGLPYDGQLPTTQRISEDDYAQQKALFLKSIGAI